MTSPLFSVIVPVFNCDKYLRNTLNNLTNQSFKDIEVICIDDGSDDNSLQILKEYQLKDNRITIIEQTNKGAGAARNTGLKAAKGEYISFIDADDFVSTNLYQKIYDIVKKNDNDMVIFNAGFFNQKTKKILNDVFLIISTVNNHVNEDTLHTYKDFKYLFYEHESVVNKIYKKSFLDEHSFSFNEDSYFEDRIFQIKTLLNAKKISILNERLYLYRINRKNSMNSKIFDKNSRIIFLVFSNIEELEKLIFNKFPNLKDDFFDYAVKLCTYYFIHADKALKNEYYKAMRDKFVSMHQNYCNSDNIKKFKNYSNFIVVIKNKNKLIYEIKLFIDYLIFKFKLLRRKVNFLHCHII